MPARLASCRMCCFERLVLHRPELVEQRLDEDRRHHDDQHQERHGQQARVEPPPARAPPQQQIWHPQEERADDDAHRQGRDAVADPLGEGLVRETVGVLAHELLVVGARQIDHVRDHREDREVDGDDEEPLASDPHRPVPHARREPREQNQGRQHEAPDGIGHPEDDAAAIAGHRLLTRLRHRDRALVAGGGPGSPGVAVGGGGWTGGACAEAPGA